MIRKFSKIANMAVFKDFTWDDSVKDSQGTTMELKEVNIIYGHNYSGKTTLSRILRAFETGFLSDKYYLPSFTLTMNSGEELHETNIQGAHPLFRVFNEDFVRDNLRFITNQEDGIVPFAVLGEDNNRIESEIAVLQAEIGSDVTGNETGLYSKLVDKRTVRDAATACHSDANSELDRKLSKKATDQQIGIKYQYGRFGMQNYNIANLKLDITNVMEQGYSNLSKDEISGYESQLTEQAKPDAPEITSIVPSWNELYDLCQEICVRKIGISEKIHELLKDIVLNNWVHDGIKLNEGRDHCAFCGQALTNERWQELYKHFDEESEQLATDINLASQQIEDEILRFENGFFPNKDNFYARFVANVEHLLDKYSIAKNKYKDKLAELKGFIEKRQNSIALPIEFSYDKSYDPPFTTIFEQYEKVRQQSQDYTSLLNTNRTVAQNALRLYEVHRYLLEIDYIDCQKNITELEQKKNTAIENYAAIKEELSSKLLAVEDKKRLLNDEEKGALKVNDYLKDFFGHHYLSLQAVSSGDGMDKIIHFEIVRNGQRAYNLSEGERSLIAFCYFVAKLEEIETKGNNPIIWIDDPISSLDGNHIFFTFSIIQSVILTQYDYKQFFLSTHNLTFLKYLRRLNINKRKDGRRGSCCYLTVERNGQESTIKLMPKYLKEHGTEFNHWFARIYNCSEQMSVTDVNYSLFEDFGNNARKFFEIYLYYRYPNDENDGEKLKKFFGDDIVPPILLSKINDEYSHAQGDLENASLPFNEPEVLLAAKCIIKKLQEDGPQYEALINSIK